MKKLDIIIPCYNAAETIVRAAQSCLKQSCLNILWLIDDGSTDNTWQILQQLAHEFPQIHIQKLPENKGAAWARNWGALHSRADFMAFLDADDEYQDNALNAAYFSLQQFDYLGLIRLRLEAVGLPEKFVAQPNFANAWHSVSMTVVSNTVWRRVFFWACGGFPTNELFRKLGGEDGALGLATVVGSVVATLFDDSEPAVLHHWRDGIHAEHLLNAWLFPKHARAVTAEQIAQAQAVTDNIVAQFGYLKAILNAPQFGTMPLKVSRA